MDIKLVFFPYKLRTSFSLKDSIPASLRSRVVHTFSCAGCGACYVSETNRHLATRIREHLFTNKKFHITRHLKSSENCFSILDVISNHFQLKGGAAYSFGKTVTQKAKSVTCIGFEFGLVMWLRRLRLLWLARFYDTQLTTAPLIVECQFKY